MDLEEGNFDLPFQHAVEKTMETFDNNAPISNLPFDSLKEPEGFMEDIEQYSYAEDQNFSSSLPINNEEMIQKSEVKEEKEKIDVNDVGVPEQLIINGKEFNFEQLDPNDIEKHEQLRAALSQLLGNTNASTFQSPSQINPVTSTPLIPPSMPDFNENSAQPSTVKNYSLFPRACHQLA